MQATTTKHHGNLSILDRIVAAKRERIEEDKAATSLGAMVGAAEEVMRIRVQAAASFPAAEGTAKLSIQKRTPSFDESIGSKKSVSVIAEMNGLRLRRA